MQPAGSTCEQLPSRGEKRHKPAVARYSHHSRWHGGDQENGSIPSSFAMSARFKPRSHSAKTRSLVLLAIFPEKSVQTTHFWLVVRLKAVIYSLSRKRRASLLM
jgi:hypothetical protein